MAHLYTPRNTTLACEAIEKTFYDFEKIKKTIKGEFVELGMSINRLKNKKASLCRMIESRLPLQDTKRTRNEDRLEKALRHYNEHPELFELDGKDGRPSIQEAAATIIQYINKNPAIQRMYHPSSPKCFEYYEKILRKSYNLGTEESSLHFDNVSELLCKDDYRLCVAMFRLQSCILEASLNYRTIELGTHRGPNIFLESKMVAWINQILFTYETIYTNWKTKDKAAKSGLAPISKELMSKVSGLYSMENYVCVLMDCFDLFTMARKAILDEPHKPVSFTISAAIAHIGIVRGNTPTKSEIYRGFQVDVV